MIVTLNINNQYYADGITELARIGKLNPENLCVELICNTVDNFYKDRRQWEETYVLDHLPERAKREIDRFNAIQENMRK